MNNSGSNWSQALWQPVAGAYLIQLRIHVLLIHGALCIALVIASQVLPNIPSFKGSYLFIPATLITLSATAFLGVWAKKRALRTCYCIRERDINLQKGLLFWQCVSVSYNRIQHIEVNQGPIEQRLGIARLSFFTAGTVGSDLSIPGLPKSVANTIKEHTLLKINLEDAERIEDKPTNTTETVEHGKSHRAQQEHSDNYAG